MPKGRRTWDEDMDGKLTEMWCVDRSDPAYLNTDEIAKEMIRLFPDRQSITRNSIISRARRIGISETHPRSTAHVAGQFAKGGSRDAPIKKPDAANISAAAHKAYEKVNGTAVVNPVGRIDKLTPERAERLKAAEAQFVATLMSDTERAAMAVPMMDAADNQCLWPVREEGRVTFVCGCPRRPGSYTRPSMYCHEHSKVASGGSQAMTPRNHPAPRRTHRRNGAWS